MPADLAEHHGMKIPVSTIPPERLRRRATY